MLITLFILQLWLFQPSNMMFDVVIMTQKLARPKSCPSPPTQWRVSSPGGKVADLPLWRARFMRCTKSISLIFDCWWFSWRDRAALVYILEVCMLLNLATAATTSPASFSWVGGDVESAMYWHLHLSTSRVCDQDGSEKAEEIQLERDESCLFWIWTGKAGKTVKSSIRMWQPLLGVKLGQTCNNTLSYRSKRRVLSVRMLGRELALKWAYRSGGLSNSRYLKAKRFKHLI